VGEFASGEDSNSCVCWCVNYVNAGESRECYVGIMRWTLVSENPNSAEALRHRESELSSARHSPVDDRIPYLVELARAKRVLDVGVVDHVIEENPRQAHLHIALSGVASSCVGIDIVESGVAALSMQGYDVRLGDIMAPGLAQLVGTDFDIVIAGELIEHVGEPIAMLDNAKSVLVEGGRLVLTTPNPYCLRLISDHVRGKVRENVDHLFYYFPSGIAELASRYGWDLVSYRGARDPRSARSLRRRMAKLTEKALTEDISCWTYIYELQPSRAKSN
jgi:SAM-dependent methyltransferase